MRQNSRYLIKLNSEFMDLPTRIKQHKSESDSYAILLYKLREIGIFRNVTDSDYGIDFEVEIVEGTSVTGRYFKAQVKSSENLKIRKKDQVPVVGGIKESTLYYWAELSYKTHVILYAVDLKTEQIYLSRPIFWQAAKLINGDKKTKSVEFISFGAKASDKKLLEALPVFLTKVFASSPSLAELIYAHKTALRYLKQFLELYVDACHYDGHVELNNLDGLKTLLDISRILLWEHDLKNSGLSEEQKKYLYSFDYWVKNSGEWATSEVTNTSAQAPLRALLPPLVGRLRELRNRVFEAKYYWRIKDRPYLRLVYDVKLPPDSTAETLSEWGYNFDQHQHEVVGFSWFELLKASELESAGIKL